MNIQKSKKFKILTIGGTGLVGSRVNEILSKKYILYNLSTQSGVDITRNHTLTNITNDKDHQYIILYASKTDVDGCEKDKDLGESGDAYKMNVTGVKNVVNAAKVSNKKLIYISSDFVFDGINTPVSGYKEEDIPHPVNWYGQTKYLGEEIIRGSGLSFIIIRIGYPYRKEFVKKKDFARAILSRLQSNITVSAVTDHYMTPAYIDDIAYAMDLLISTEKQGTFHVTGSQSLSPYNAAILIADKFNLNKSLISKSTRSEFFKNRAPRPFNLKMNNDKICRLGIKMRTFDQGIREIKNQISKIKT